MQERIDDLQLPKQKPMKVKKQEQQDEQKRPKIKSNPDRPLLQTVYVYGSFDEENNQFLDDDGNVFDRKNTASEEDLMKALDAGLI